MLISIMILGSSSGIHLLKACCKKINKLKRAFSLAHGDNMAWCQTYEVIDPDNLQITLMLLPCMGLWCLPTGLASQLVEPVEAALLLVMLNLLPGQLSGDLPGGLTRSNVVVVRLLLCKGQVYCNM